MNIPSYRNTWLKVEARVRRYCSDLSLVFSYDLLQRRSSPVTSPPATAFPAAISSDDVPSSFLSLPSPASSPPKSQRLPFVLDQKVTVD
ncbi:hypothetical protein Ahy_B10g102138 isoform D [Arachis hypogaea]|uniref:Uncharacterized protein n=1 Tax=Arachis hypogaea TaxID=3818 RepID=A0A444X163_ARAHY|nr:hypothetical protein Ahy_B10g102138 isoform D [Arachis hypogaea]